MLPCVGITKFRYHCSMPNYMCHPLRLSWANAEFLFVPCPVHWLSAVYWQTQMAKPIDTIPICDIDLKVSDSKAMQKGKTLPQAFIASPAKALCGSLNRQSWESVMACCWYGVESYLRLSIREARVSGSKSSTMEGRLLTNFETFVVGINSRRADRRWANIYTEYSLSTLSSQGNAVTRTQVWNEDSTWLWKAVLTG